MKKKGSILEDVVKIISRGRILIRAVQLLSGRGPPPLCRPHTILAPSWLHHMYGFLSCSGMGFSAPLSFAVGLFIPLSHPVLAPGLRTGSRSQREKKKFKTPAAAIMMEEEVTVWGHK